MVRRRCGGGGVGVVRCRVAAEWVMGLQSVSYSQLHSSLQTSNAFSSFAGEQETTCHTVNRVSRYESSTWKQTAQLSGHHRQTMRQLNRVGLAVPSPTT